MKHLFEYIINKDNLSKINKINHYLCNTYCIIWPSGDLWDKYQKKYKNTEFDILIFKAYHIFVVPKEEVKDDINNTEDLKVFEIPKEYKTIEEVVSEIKDTEGLKRIFEF